MRALNPREKILAVMVLTGLCFLGGGWLNRRLAETGKALDAQLSEAQANLKSSQLLLKAPAPKTAPVVAPASEIANRLTLTLLRDLTVPEEAASIRVVGLEKVGENGFRLSIEGGFPEVMRFVSFLERPESRFAILDATVEKLALKAASTSAGIKSATGTMEMEAETGSPSREVRAVLGLSVRGSGRGTG